jgi:hypothetical protein
MPDRFPEPDLDPAWGKDTTEGRPSPLDLALLAILGEFKGHEIDFRQALTEIKQAVSYHAPQRVGPTSPTLALLCKLGSIAVHTEEYLSAGGHDFDREALKSLLADPEVRSWREEMDGMAMLPRKRATR